MLCKVSGLFITMISEQCNINSAIVSLFELLGSLLNDTSGCVEGCLVSKCHTRDSYEGKRGVPATGQDHHRGEQGTQSR